MHTDQTRDETEQEQTSLKTLSGVLQTPEQLLCKV